MPDGRPLASAEVLPGGWFKGEIRLGAVSVYATRQGQFVFAVPANPNLTFKSTITTWLVPGAPWMFSAYAQGVNARPGAVKLDLQLPPTREIKVRVVDGEGLPLKGAKLQFSFPKYDYYQSRCPASGALASSGGCQAWLQLARGTTDAMGWATFWMAETALGVDVRLTTEYSFSASGPTFHDARQFAIAADTSLLIAADRESLISLSGQVVRHDGTSVAALLLQNPGSKVSGYVMVGGTSAPINPVTGRFEILVPAGTVSVHGWVGIVGIPGAPSYVGFHAPPIELLQNRQLDLRLPEAHPLTISVVDDSGAPLVGATVTFAKNAGPNAYPYCPTAVTDLPGEGCETRLPAPIIVGNDGLASTWIIESPSDQAWTSVVRSVASDGALLYQSLDFRVDGPSSQTVTVDRADLVRVAGQFLRADGVPIGGGHGTGTTFNGSIRVGRFEAAIQVGDGRYEMFIPPVSGRVPIVFDFRSDGVGGVAPWILASTSLESVVSDLNLDLTLPAAHKVSVTVVDGSGNPIAGALIEFVYQYIACPAGSLHASIPLPAWTCWMTIAGSHVTDAAGSIEKWVTTTGGSRIPIRATFLEPITGGGIYPWVWETSTAVTSDLAFDVVFPLHPGGGIG